MNTIGHIANRKLAWWESNLAHETEHNGIKMTLIGGWIDLAGYYSGSDGNAWSWQGRWTNLGPIEQFRQNFASRYRGELLA